MENWYYPDTSSTAGKGFYLWHTEGGGYGWTASRGGNINKARSNTFKEEGVGSLYYRQGIAQQYGQASELVQFPKHPKSKSKSTGGFYCLYVSPCTASIE